MQPFTCFETDALPYPVKLTQSQRTMLFTVTYGKQVDRDLTYAQAAQKLGEAIMHAAACQGKVHHVREKDTREVTP